MASFKVSSAFTAKLRRMDDAARRAAGKTMKRTFEVAEEVAEASIRWRDPGYQEYTGSDGKTWGWTTTGVAQKSITGYGLAPGESTASANLQSYSAGDTYVSIDGVPTFTNTHNADPSLAGQYVAGPTKAIGVLTYYPEYVKYLAAKETQGTVSGTPGPGEPVTIETVRVVVPVTLPTMAQISFREEFAKL